MEQHPVPQNITSFQFRLIGDMTVKQFGYLAGGVILAYISYKLPLPFFFTWPMAITSALVGFGFAFVPIEERPMDIWVLSFLKNVYNPTVFHWEHTEPLPEPPKSLVPPPLKIPSLSIPGITPPSPQKTAAPTATPTIPSSIGAPKTTSTHPIQPAHKQGQSLLDSVFVYIDNLFVAKPKAPPAYIVQPQSRPNIATPQRPIQPEPVIPISMPSVTGKKIEPPAPVKPAPPVTPLPAPQEQKKEDNLNQLKNELETVQKQLSEKTTEEQKYLDLQQQLTTLMKERETMEKELLLLRNKASNQSPLPPQPTRPAGVVEAPKQNVPTIQVMNPDVATRMGLPRLTTFPNVVTGIIKDYDNNLLPGVLVTVKDKDGVPLRALKTNKLGQFAASTQLTNGTYVVEVEDPRERFVFDRVQITLNGAVMPALQIIAKSKKMLDRQALEKQIFGTPNASV